MCVADTDSPAFWLIHVICCFPACLLSPVQPHRTLHRLPQCSPNLNLNYLSLRQDWQLFPLLVWPSGDGLKDVQNFGKSYKWFSFTMFTCFSLCYLSWHAWLKPKTRSMHALAVVFIPGISHTHQTPYTGAVRQLPKQAVLIFKIMYHSYY